MPQLRIEYRPLEALIPYARNSRTHSNEQVAQIAASIQEFGWTNPILVDGDNGVIAGHGRLLGARKLGMTEVPVVELAELTPAQKRAYVIADNKLAMNAGWDLELLAVEIDELKSEEFDVSLLGFSEKELADLMVQEVRAGLTDPDAVPEPPTVPTTQVGDVWVCGPHRVMCGDSTSLDAVEALMDGVRSDMLFTDPPYGMSYGGGRSGAVGSTDGTVKKFGAIKGDDKTGEDLIALVRDAISSAIALSKPGSAKYVCFPWRTYAEFEAALEDCGLTISSCIVWDKKSIGLGNANYRPQHEFIFYCKGGAWYGDKCQSDVWYASRGATGEYVHPTQKPVELIERALVNSSKAGDILLDLFGGSGTTLIAAQKNGRIARIMEIDPIYCDVIVRRWQDYTGQKAYLEGSGVDFKEAQ